MIKAWVEEVIERLGREKISDHETEKYRHSRDESYHPPVDPEIVVFPESKSDVLILIEIAKKFGVAVTPYGVGSGLEGQAIPILGGISVNFERMNRIVEFNPEDLTVTVQPGMTRMELNKAINNHGLYFPIDPGADASIGGMVATNASGTTAVRYGSMRDQVLCLEVVLANGKVMKTGTKAKKSSSGYHLNGMFVGSEGTLGLITEVTLKLHGIPEHVVAARCTFNTPKECAEAAQTVLKSGISVMRMELVDATSIQQVNQYGGYSYPEKHSLFFEFAGTKAAVEEESGVTEELMHDLGCENWERANGSKERADLWRARHELAYAFRHMKGMAISGGDVCVPISTLADMVVYGRKLIDESGLIGGVFGHVGDGNFHTLIVFNPNEPNEVKAADYINEKLAYKAIEVGGTCTGEHGVGLGKRKFQEAEHGEALVIMKKLKEMLDPHNLLNPGKIFL